jgi:hypothetical protein
MTTLRALCCLAALATAAHAQDPASFAAKEALGLERSHLYRKMKTLSISIAA